MIVHFWDAIFDKNTHCFKLAFSMSSGVVFVQREMEFLVAKACMNYLNLDFDQNNFLSVSKLYRSVVI